MLLQVSHPLVSLIIWPILQTTHCVEFKASKYWWVDRSPTCILLKSLVLSGGKLVVPIHLLKLKHPSLRYNNRHACARMLRHIKIFSWNFGTYTTFTEIPRDDEK